MEEWRDIVGYEGIYQVSNIGRVKSLERVRCHGKKYKEKINVAKDVLYNCVNNPCSLFKYNYSKRI